MPNVIQAAILTGTGKGDDVFILHTFSFSYPATCHLTLNAFNFQFPSTLPMTTNKTHG